MTQNNEDNDIKQPDSTSTDNEDIDMATNLPASAEQDVKTVNTNETTKIDDLMEDLLLAERRAEEIKEEDGDAIVPWVIELRVIGTPEIIRAPLGERLTIGRGDRNREIYPEIDLTDHHGQRMGVSRKHARLIMRDNRLTIEDIGSSNGTFVNGIKIGVLSPTRLRDGDQIRLGNLPLQVHFVIQPSTNEDTMHGLGNMVDVAKVGNGERLLILDDNKQLCAVVRMIALQAGFNVSVSHSTQDAIAQWDKGDVDVVMVELMLEEDNGLDLVDYVRQDTEKRAPIIATMSTFGGYRENQALAKGVDELLSKPLSVDSIMAALGKVTEILTD